MGACIRPVILMPLLFYNKGCKIQPKVAFVHMTLAAPTVPILSPPFPPIPITNGGLIGRKGRELRPNTLGFFSLFNRSEF